MKNILQACVALPFAIFAVNSFAAPGEYWEITSKMEMPGMPFAMPATTAKVCIPKGGESDPRNSQSKDSKCTFTDIQHSGNTVKYKGTCVSRDTTMNMSGETSHDSNSFHTKMKMSGDSHGRPMNMSMDSSGKRVGGSCDTEEQANKIKGEICDTTRFDAREWISRADFFLNNSTCPGKKEPLCNAVRKDAPRDADVYELLLTTEKNNGNLIAKTCGLNMEATTKSLCKTVNGHNVGKLSAYCPAEAKAYREVARKKECEGRSYTAHEDLSKCLNGQGGDDNAGEGGSHSNAEADKPKSGADNPAKSVLEGAKKLKGLFGF